MKKTKKEKGYEIPVKYDLDQEVKRLVNASAFVFSHEMENFEKTVGRCMPFVVYL